MGGCFQLRGTEPSPLLAALLPHVRRVQGTGPAATRLRAIGAVWSIPVPMVAMGAMKAHDQRLGAVVLLPEVPPNHHRPLILPVHRSPLLSPSSSATAPSS